MAKEVDLEMAEQAAEKEEQQPDMPPESFWLSRDSEFDWFDRNAIYERNESTRPNSNSTNLNPNLHPNSNSSSHRFSINLKSKASVIGLPKTTYADTPNRRKYKPANIRLFPKRSQSIGKSEPSSPKVSCMGRVRSKRNRRKSSNSVEKSRSGGGRKGTWVCGCFTAIFRSDRKSKAVIETVEPPLVESPPPPRRSVTVKVGEISARDEPESGASVEEPPGLGGMKRFVSGRRAVSWDTDDMDK
ncbi:unnamed protein product [Camellia sinensis]